MYNKLVEVLDKLEKPIPQYALLLGDDLKMEYGNFKTTFMKPLLLVWETLMALHSAVKYTEAGWIDNVEVVKVFSMNLGFL
jgi:hypothetical protein